MRPVLTATLPAEVAPPRSRPSHAASTPSGRRRAVLLHLGVLVGLLAVSVAVWWRVWLAGHPGSTITCQCGDPSQALWFLSWTPWAVLHGHNPFFTNAIFAGQGGANMLANTSWMLPSTVLAPITLGFGPIAAFNVAVTAAPALSGWSLFLAARRVTTFVPGQCLAALLYGFSPFLVWNDPYGHFNFTLLLFPPLAFLLLHDLLVTRRHRPVLVGLGLGLLVVAQFFTGTEYLAMSVVLGAVVLVAACLMAPREAWRHRWEIATGLGTAAGVSVALLAYPVWFAVAGPRHIVGAAWPGSAALGAPPGALVEAGRRVHDTGFANVVSGSYGGIGPNFAAVRFPSYAYLGLPLVVLLAVSVVTWWRSRVAWSLVVLGVVAWVCSWGTSLGTQYGPRATRVDAWWVPWHLLSGIPLVSEILPIRFGGLVAFAAAMLLAVSLDGWWRLLAVRLGGRSAGGRRSRLVPLAVLLTAVGAAALLPVAATTPVPYVVRTSATPAWFTRVAPRLPPATRVLAVPFAGQTAMGWQAQTDLRFDLVGGFAVVPGPAGRSVFVSPPARPVRLLDRLSQTAQTVQGVGPPAGTPSQVSTVRGAMDRWGVQVVVVTGVGGDPAYSAGFMTAVLGRAPRIEDGSWVWDGLGGAAPLHLPRGALDRCTAVADHGRPGAVPSCVLAAARAG